MQTAEWLPLLIGYLSRMGFLDPISFNGGKQRNSKNQRNLIRTKQNEMSQRATSFASVAGTKWNRPTLPAGLVTK